MFESVEQDLCEAARRASTGPGFAIVERQGGRADTWIDCMDLPQAGCKNFAPPRARGRNIGRPRLCQTPCAPCCRGVVRPYRALFVLCEAPPGRCPGLVCGAPLGLLRGLWRHQTERDGMDGMDGGSEREREGARGGERGREGARGDGGGRRGRRGRRGRGGGGVLVCVALFGLSLASFSGVYSGERHSGHGRHCADVQ